MQALVFLGCTVPVRNLNYEASARKVAGVLGVELSDLPEMGCCGFPLKSADWEGSLTVAARVLAQAGGSGLELTPLCSACAGHLAEAAHYLDHDESARQMVNAKLKGQGLEYKPGVRVRHLMRYILEEVGLDAIKEKVVRPLEGFSFAPHYGCHYIKPSEVLGGFDDPDAPSSLHKIIEAAGARAVDYPAMKECCGGGVLGVDEDLAGCMAGSKLTELNQMDITALALICPFCNVMYEGQQKLIAKKMETKLKVPVVYLTQVLGLALGLTPDELGFKLNRSKPKDLVKAYKK